MEKIFLVAFVMVVSFQVASMSGSYASEAGAAVDGLTEGNFYRLERRAYFQLQNVSIYFYCSSSFIWFI